MAAVTACSFCGTPIAEAEQIFQNEDHSSAVCSVCVASFAQNLVEAGEDSEE
jgi:hypothetical protein